MEEIHAIFSALDVAKYICKKYFDDKEAEISEIKLQKCLYFLFAYWGGFNAKNNSENVEEKFDYSQYLFFAQFEAWVYGPVIPTIYFSRKNNELLYDDLNVEKMFEGKEFIKETIDSLLDDLFEISDFKLVSLSHNDKVWQNNFDVNDDFHNAKMPLDSIIREYACRETI